jgi:hypothetical protein
MKLHFKIEELSCFFEVEVPALPPNCVLWNTAFCCVKCGRTWARTWYEHDGSVPVKWQFLHTECEYHSVFHRNDFDFFLLRDDLTPSQMRMLIHEYARCPEYLSVYRPGSSAGNPRPTLDDL